MHLNAKSNEYADCLPNIDQIPKAVLAAVAVSLFMRLGYKANAAEFQVWHEWNILYQNGIVPQKPPRRKRDYDDGR